MRQSRKTNPKPRDTSAKDSPVRHVIMPPTIKYDYQFPVVRMRVYVFEEEMMQTFGVMGGGLVAVETFFEPTPGMVLACRQGEAYHVGRVIYDRFSNFTR